MVIIEKGSAAIRFVLLVYTSSGSDKFNTVLVSVQFSKYISSNWFNGSVSVWNPNHDHDRQVKSCGKVKVQQCNRNQELFWCVVYSTLIREEYKSVISAVMTSPDERGDDETCEVQQGRGGDLAKVDDVYSEFCNIRVNSCSSRDASRFLWQLQIVEFGCISVWVVILLKV